MLTPGRLSLTPGLQTNPDGSTDIFFGPKAPAGKESNWFPTPAGGRFETIFRFYGPDKPLFEKPWGLPDLEPLEKLRQSLRCATRRSGKCKS